MGNKLNHIDTDELIKLNVEERMNASDIARKFEIDRRTIFARFKRAGHKALHYNQGLEKIRPFLDKPVSAISQDTGLTNKQVYNILDFANIPIVRRE